MKRILTDDESAEYFRLSNLAAGIERALETLIVEITGSTIPDTAKCAALDWIARADTVRGLGYFLAPQSEWTGGDSSDPHNFQKTSPHIER